MLLRIFGRILREYDQYHVERVRQRFAACGDRVVISPKCFIWGENKMNVGDDVAIHAFTHIFASGGVTLGTGTQISSNCSISTVTHSIPNVYTEEQIERPVVTGRCVWIGTGAVIIPGVTIGDFSVIGAGAVVTRSVPAYSVAVGNPARVVRSFSDAEMAVARSFLDEDPRGGAESVSVAP